MGAQGNTTIDFGAIPGKSDASVTITGQTGIIAGSCVEAWLRGEASADHTSDEHLVESIKVMAMDIVAGTGFTIKAVNTSEIHESLRVEKASNTLEDTNYAQRKFNEGGRGTLLFGVWNVSWVWN